MTTNVLVTYYSSTGSVFRLAEAVIAGAEKAGADVRLRRVPATADIQHKHGNPYGASHVAADGQMPDDVSLLSAQHLGERVATVAVHTAHLRAS